MRLLILCGLIFLSSLVLWQGTANPPREDNIFWQSDDLSALPEISTSNHFTLEVTATLPDDQLAEWGIWLDNGNQTWTLVAINGGQYVTARICPAFYTGKLHDCDPFTEPNQRILTYWKAFHHIHRGGETNTIRLHRTNAHLALRLNNEWMWDIPFEATAERLQWGLWTGEQYPEWEQATIWN
ncbi:MAG: hypothetical protein L0154_20005 [Chloroflexi bacterium]|nr:hypothetical protein [Chloroflexota bacterium]